MSDTSRSAAIEHLIDGVGALMRRMRTSGMFVAQACGLQPTHAQLLFALRRLGECRVAALAETQMVDPSVVSRQVAALERLGLVERRTDPDDARASLVSLTDAGHAKLLEVRRLHVDVVTDALADWPTDRMSRFADDFADFLAATGPVYERLAPGAVPATSAAREMA